MRERVAQARSIVAPGGRLSDRRVVGAKRGCLGAPLFAREITTLGAVVPDELPDLLGGDRGQPPDERRLAAELEVRQVGEGEDHRGLQDVLGVGSRAQRGPHPPAHRAADLLSEVLENTADGLLISRLRGLDPVLQLLITHRGRVSKN